MTEINKAQNVSLQNVDLTLQPEKTKVDETEDMNIFGAQSGQKDIGDIHGNSKSHKYGNINGTKFDINVDYFSTNIDGQVNGKKVELDYKPGFLTYDKYAGSIGNKKVQFTSKNGYLGLTKQSCNGSYGNTKFDLNYKEIAFSNKKSISGTFGNKEINIEIDENLFEADDILTVDNLPKDMEEFFPVLYTVMNYRYERNK